MKNMKKLSIIMMFCLIFCSLSASALTIGGIDGSWSNAFGLPEYQQYIDRYTSFQSNSIDYGDRSEKQVRWGRPTSNTENSGLGFAGVAAGSFFDFGEIFEIGQLRHFNYEIYLSTAATSVDFSLSFSIDEIPVALSFDFTFQINETPNVDAEGNKFPVDDIIGFADASRIQTFTYDDMIYTLEVIGFGDTPEDIDTQFISAEYNESATRLFGRLSAQPILPPEPPDNPAVPEPATLLLLGLGLLGLAALRKRAK